MKGNNTSEDINMDGLREGSVLSYTNLSRKSSTYSELFLVSYVDRIEI